MKSAASPRRIWNRRPQSKHRPGAEAAEHVRSGGEPSYTATEAKNEFGTLLDQASRGATVIITKHDSPRAVLISIEQFHALQRAPQVKLDSLSAEFDALLERLQSTKARSSMQAAFDALPGQLGKAAVAAARKRG